MQFVWMNHEPRYMHGFPVGLPGILLTAGLDCRPDSLQNGVNRFNSFFQLLNQPVQGDI